MKKRFDCSCEYCRWWKADRREMYEQTFCMALCMGVLIYCLLA